VEGLLHFFNISGWVSANYHFSKATLAGLPRHGRLRRLLCHPEKEIAGLIAKIRDY
jgi:hypothetical protein